MTTLTNPVSPSVSTPAHRLQATMAAVRVGFTWFGVRKTLTQSQKAQAAETFGAEGQYLSAAKKLLDTRCPAFQAVTAVRNRVLAYWRGMSLPYPEPGIRLIRQDRIEQFNDQMTEMRQDLLEAAQQLDRQLPALKQAAKDRLGELYNPADYPNSLEDLFAVQWEFPSVEPPEYLLQLKPELYEQERRRMTARFEEAVTLAEEAFTAELARLVSHLTDRLTGTEDGKPRIFRDSALENLHEFFERFRSLSVRSNQQLEEVVRTAQKALRGVEPQKLRDAQSLREEVAKKLSGVQSVLDGMMVERPRRKILRPTLKETA